MEARYEDMNKRNGFRSCIPRIVKDISKGRCIAAYAVGDWYLQPSFPRWMKKLQEIVGDSACLYKAVPDDGEGLLHQTLLQFLGFDSFSFGSEDQRLEAMKCVADVLTTSNLSIWITYKGWVWTPTGLALAGYCDQEELVQKVRDAIEQALKMKHLPCHIPYKHDILHATILRWTKEPDRLALLKLERELDRWSECTFGELRVREWIIGVSSLRQLSHEREDYFRVPVYKHICHRGNLYGPNKQEENNPSVLIQREIEGLAVEVDVWYHEGGVWIGHDRPEYKVTWDWLAASRNRLLHAKDGKTLEFLLQESGKRGIDLHIFYHTEEDYVVTNKGIVICYPGKPLLKGSLCMMPERARYSVADIQNVFCVCSDSLRKRNED